MGVLVRMCVCAGAHAHVCVFVCIRHQIFQPTEFCQFRSSFLFFFANKLVNFHQN